ncbi:MAG: GPR endopeptidase [Clostridia bacterium]|nr:GPR endopeptidase [Clostridia bacterium]
MKKRNASRPLLFDSDLSKERCPAKGAKGIDYTEYKKEHYVLTEVTVRLPEAAKRLGRPMGKYATLQFDGTAFLLREVWEAVESATAALLREALPAERPRLLVVGLGNRRLAVDSIGTRTAESVTATAAWDGLFKEQTSETSVSVFCPGVYGESGMEAAELVKAAVKLTRASAVLAIDAMATARVSHLLRAIELTDTGTVPGAGVGNHRLPLSRETLGVPVVAMGVPTMMRARPHLRRALVDFGVEIGHADSYSQKEKDLLLIPSALEDGITDVSRLAACAINRALGFQTAVACEKGDLL